MRIALWSLCSLFIALSGTTRAAEVWHRTVRIDLTLAADGSYDSSETWEVRADNLTTSQMIAQQTFGFSASLEQTTIVTAFTRKANGDLIPVDLASAVLPQAVGATARYPSFNDWQSRSIVFPDVEPGDTVHFELRRRSIAPLFPGNFARRFDLGPHANIEAADIAISMPASMHLAIDPHGLADAGMIRQGQRLRHSWQWRAQGSGDVWLDVSTFPDYPALGQAFAARARQSPSPETDALAHRLIADVTDRPEQARRLYEWVATNIRYVDVQVGQGRVVPHPVAQILRNRYGDCKDHAALLQALLAAAGIASEPTLISSSHGDELPPVATMAVIDHVILYIPEFRLYLDSTSPFAAFGTLPFSDTGKPVVIADPQGSRVGRTPHLSGSATEVAIRTEVTIDENGAERGQTDTSATGPAATALKETAVDLSIEGPTEAASRMLRANGTPGNGATSYPDPYVHTPDFTVKATYSTGGPILSRAAIWLQIPIGLPQVSRYGALFVSLRGGTGGHVCYAGHQTEDLRLNLPPWARATAVPRDVEVSGGPLSYRATYRMQRGTILVHRELALDVDRPICSEAEYHALLPVLSAIKQDLESGVTLTPPLAPAHRTLPIARGVAGGMNG